MGGVLMFLDPTQVVLVGVAKVDRTRGVPLDLMSMAEKEVQQELE